MNHAPFPPSSASVWGHCTGSLIATSSFPDVETEESRNGAAAHWAVEQTLMAWLSGMPAAMCKPSAFVGVLAPNGVVIDHSHAEGAEVCTNDVMETIGGNAEGRANLRVEHRVYMPTVHADNWGTLDVKTMIGNTLYLWDYKHGHLRVEAKGNLQLVDYLEGLRLEAGIDGLLDRMVSFDARIVQPYSYDPKGPIDSWRGSLSEIRPHVSFLSNAAAESRVNPTLSSGSHCRYCAARPTCSANRKSGYNAIDVSRQPMAFDRMNGSDVAAEYDIVTRGMDALKARQEALRDELMHRVEKGDASTGYALASVKGRLKWIGDPEQTIAAVAALGIDIKRVECDTPAQAKAKLPPAYRENFEEMVKGIAKRTNSVKLTDVSKTIGARTFGKK